ncbi:MAG TPA: arylsulfatase [Pirellulales bacterium]|jgi:arylsulfatase|nr:arylsulfatase [Pirellulales bacterium]
MNRSLFAALAALAFLTGQSMAALPSRPNIILVMTDDQGYGELSCHGNPILKTPHLDAFAAQSVRFNDFQVSPTCSPTRASLMTGRHEFRSGITHTIDERERMSLSAVTIAQMLKDAGYATAIFGKWHLGDEAPYQPGRRGFDEVFIHGAGGIGQTYPGSCGDAPGNSYFNPAILHNGVFEKTEGFCTDVFFRQATKWIDARRHEPQPFFVYLCTNAPHGPMICPEKYSKPYLDQGLSKDEAAYYGMIANIDEDFGKLMRQLDDWHLSEKTLVIFMTDNGHPMQRLYNAGMHGAKGTPYEGGTHVPAFWRWTGVLEPRDCDQLAAHIDIFPTFAELAGATIPPGLKLDGRSLVPLLENPAAPWPDRMLFVNVARWPRGHSAEAKYAKAAVRTNRWRLVKNSELYDIKHDPGETKNVIAEHPDVAARLRAAYDQWWDEVIPATKENENATGPDVNPFAALYWKQFGGGPVSK